MFLSYTFNRTREIGREKCQIWMDSVLWNSWQGWCFTSAGKCHCQEIIYKTCLQDIVSHRKFLSFYFKSNFKYYLQFSVHVEMGLMSKNLNGSQRNEFIRDICTLITTNTRYPTEPERQMIAQKIVTKYPFLKDPKIGNCSTEWVRIKYIIMYIINSPPSSLSHTKMCCEIFKRNQR